MVECYQCGSQNAFGLRFCVNCGAEFQYRCPQCNSGIEPGIRFCTDCGAEFEWGELPDSWQLETSLKEIKPSEPEAIEDYESQREEQRQERPRRRRRTPLLIALIVIIICIIAVFIIDAILGNGQSVQSPAAISSSDSVPPALSVSAEDLSKAYGIDELAADDQYKGEIIAVTGKINAIGTNVVDIPFVKLSGGSIEAWEIQCMFDKDHSNALAQLEEGQVVTIQGKCDGYYMAIKMKDCALID